MRKHAPGPWHRLPRLIHNMLGISDADGVFVAHIAEHSNEFDHARLIAAAPDMLEALKECERMLSRDNPADGWADAITGARAAIAKAEG